MKASLIKPNESYDVVLWDGKPYDEAAKEGNPNVVPTTPSGNELPRGLIMGYPGSILEGDSNTVHPGDAVVTLFVDDVQAAVVGLELERAIMLFNLTAPKVPVEEELPALPASSLTDDEHPITLGKLFKGKGHK